VIRVKSACVVKIWHAISIDSSRVFFVQVVHDSVVPREHATQMQYVWAAQIGEEVSYRLQQCCGIVQVRFQ
jgi:hypothetical protein